MPRGELSRTIRRVKGHLSGLQQMTADELRQAQAVLERHFAASPRRLLRAYWLARVDTELYDRDVRHLLVDGLSERQWPG